MKDWKEEVEMRHNPKGLSHPMEILEQKWPIKVVLHWAVYNRQFAWPSNLVPRKKVLNHWDFSQ